MWQESIKLSGGGGTPTQTLLWENPSPRKSFSSTTITLSNSASNFDIVKITAKRYYTDSSINDTLTTYFMYTNNAVSDVIYSYTSNSDLYYRCYYLVSGDTTIRFESAYNYNGSSASTANYYLIPIQVIGIKY